MAHAPARSMNVELQEGLNDGKYKRITPDRTNIDFPSEQKIAQERMHDLAWPYGVNEPEVAYTPEGKIVRKNPRY